jgi:hypothetical protein
MDLRVVGWGAWTGSIWLRIGTGGGLLWIRWWTFGFHKVWGISWLAENLLASQEWLCFLELVTYLVMTLREQDLCVCVCVCVDPEDESSKLFRNVSYPFTSLHSIISLKILSAPCVGLEPLKWAWLRIVFCCSSDVLTTAPSAIFHFMQLVTNTLLFRSSDLLLTQHACNQNSQIAWYNLLCKANSLVKKPTVFSGTQRFISLFTRAGCCGLSVATSIHAPLLTFIT